jgi:alpha-tubulin suppressor-like RCC1 family protein
VVAVTYLGVAAGGGHTMAIKSDGTLLAWGLNRNGQLGDGTSADKLTPTAVGLTGTTLGSVISAGEFHSAALSACATAGCSLATWGSNDSGRLGDGTTVEKRSPTKITGTTWLAVAAGGSHTVAIKKDGTTGGTLWSWGRNDKGQLGLGTANAANLDNKSVPTREASGFATWSSVAAGALHTVGLLQTGMLAGWGANDRGQLGVNSAITPVSYAAPIAQSSKFLSVAAGGDHTLAILNSGALFAWGANGFGQLGIGSLVDAFAPVPVTEDIDWESVSAGGSHNDKGSDQPGNGGHSLAIKTDGTLWAWGANAYGQLGLGHKDDTTVPTQVGKERGWKRVSAGKLHTFAWKADGSLWGWGNNLNGQLGNGFSGDAAKNVLVPTRLN